MELIMFGPPGSGKGTYASRLGSRLEIANISTGDIFREAKKQGTDLGIRVAEFLKRGELVPDEITIEVLKERISRPDCKMGFILDGYPRTLEQARALDKIARIDTIILLIVPEWIIIERLSNRRVCRNCGAIYNIKYLKPKREGMCDKCGGELYQREDDTPKVIKERLKVYERQTQPLIDYYKDRVPFVNAECKEIDMPPENMVEIIIQKLRKMKLIS
jgi:adenylate kinase